MNQQPQHHGLLSRLTGKFRPKSKRRSDELATVRIELQRRGVKVDQLSDPDIEDAISSGRRVLGSASVRGSDVTGAFVVLVRSQENI